MRAAFYQDAVAALDETYGGPGAAGVVGTTSFGSPDSLFNDVLTKLNWTRNHARDKARQGGICLGAEESVLEHMARQNDALCNGNCLVAYDPDEHELATAALKLLRLIASTSSHGS